jgi:hypothetical protein
MVHLASTIHHSSVIVNIASTMAIDAAVLDKPVVAVAFGATGKRPRSKFFDDIFEHSHYRKLAVTGGLHIVQSLEELVDAVRAYLDNPAIDADGRNRLRESLCFQLDGQAGARAAAVVLRQLGLSDVLTKSSDEKLTQYARAIG